jgi:fatty-acid desaturase
METPLKFEFIIELHRATESQPDVRECILEVYRQRSEHLKLLIQMFWGLAAALTASMISIAAVPNTLPKVSSVLLCFSVVGWVVVLISIGAHFHRRLSDCAQQITTSWQLYRLFEKSSPENLL